MKPAPAFPRVSPVLDARSDGPVVPGRCPCGSGSISRQARRRPARRNRAASWEEQVHVTPGRDRRGDTSAAGPAPREPGAPRRRRRRRERRPPLGAARHGPPGLRAGPGRAAAGTRGRQPAAGGAVAAPGVPRADGPGPGRGRLGAGVPRPEADGSAVGPARPSGAPGRASACFSACTPSACGGGSWPWSSERATADQWQRSRTAARPSREFLQERFRFL
jgi:hypothetical protein